jgi:glycerol-3-phosphate dehydrogenase
MGKQQGIFLEAWSGGARTRDGSLRYPRRLVTLQGALAAENEVLVQPVVLSYSSLPEDISLSENSGPLSWINGLCYFKSWLQSPHRPIRAFIHALNGLYGRAFITFCRPKMLSELRRMWSENGSDLQLDEFVSLDSIKEIAKDKKVMASHLAAKGLIRARREGTSDLAGSLEAELTAVVDYHQRTFGQDPDLEDFIRNNTTSAILEDGLRTLKRRRVIGLPKRKGQRPPILADNALSYFATHADRRLYSPSAKENIVIIGVGTWGYALACLVGHRTLDDKRYFNSSLTLFDPRVELIGSIVDSRRHPEEFTKVRIPKNVFLTADATAAFRKATEIIAAGPIADFAEQVRLLLAEVEQALKLIIATRGFDPVSNRLPIQIARDLILEAGRQDITLLALSGPVTPVKLAEGRGGSLVLAGPPPEANRLADLFHYSGFSVHVCNDPIGVQVAGAMAEIYSLLGSYLLRTKDLSGRGQIADFFRETSAEAMKLAEALGGSKETFLARNPAWTAEYVAAGLGGPGAYFGRQAASHLKKAKRSAQDLHDSTEHQNLDYRLVGYFGIRSARHAAQRLGLELLRLEQAYEIFWKIQE